MIRWLPINRWFCAGCDREFKTLEEAQTHHKEVHPGFRIFYRPEWARVDDEEGIYD